MLKKKRIKNKIVLNTVESFKTKTKFLLKKKADYLFLKKVKFKWRRFFVIRIWRKKNLSKLFIRKKFWIDMRRVNIKPKSRLFYKLRHLFRIKKRKINSKSCETTFLDRYSYFFINKHSHSTFRKRYWKIIKKKKSRKLKTWYNFFFFFTRFFKNQLSTYRTYLGYKQDKSFFLLNNPHVLKKNKNRIKILNDKDKNLIRRSKKKMFVTKKTYLKKLILKRFFMGYYIIKRLNQLKFIIDSARKLFGNKVINFYFYLESRIISTCLNMCFFWNKRRGLNWIRWGYIYVNGCLVENYNFRVVLNSMVRVVVPIKIWFLWVGSKIINLDFLKFKRLSFNFYELGLQHYIGIVLNIPRRFNDIVMYFHKKKKYWGNLQTFSYLLNSYY